VIGGASSGCIDAGLYQEAFAECGVDVVVPGDDDMTQFMRLVCQIKSGGRTQSQGLSRCFEGGHGQL
jgi:aspartate/glutamate racemase